MEGKGPQPIGADLAPETKAYLTAHAETARRLKEAEAHEAKAIECEIIEGRG